MKQNTYFFFLLFLLATSALEAQTKAAHQGNTPDENVASWQQYVPAEGDHVANEAIMSFDEAQTNEQKQALERRLLKEGNYTIKEWSPSSRYALLNIISKGGYDPCDFDGNGNPDSETEGSGDQISLNYNMGANDVDTNLEDPDCLSATFDPVTGVFTVDYGNYSPVASCDVNANITPELGIGSVSVAIIDSGIRGMGPAKKINNVSVVQVVIPDNCSELSCDYYYPTIEESNTFHNHGRFITTLISGWFSAYQLEDRLKIKSYKVLDSELKCNVFQVVRAIELAVFSGNDIISLSIGFTPCAKPDTNGPTTGIDPIGGKSMTGISILHNAIKEAEEAGVIVITSAGNNGVDLDEYPQYPAAEVGLNNLVTVGALACGTQERTAFSNYSENHVDLFTVGDQVKVINGTCLYPVTGTSFATPIVAAKAAFHVTTLGRGPFSYEAVLCKLRGESIPFPGAKYGIVDTEAPTQSCNKRNASSPGGFGSNLNGVEQGMKALLSPNPFNEELTINVPEGEAELTIFDARGARVFQKETAQETTTLDLGALQAGVYWLNIRSAGGSETRKIIKQ